jgi:hypothetical protein
VKNLTEYFVITNSNAAPFFSDTDEKFIKAVSPEDALEKTRKTYSHPCGLFAAGVYQDANAYHKGSKPLVTWLSPRAQKRTPMTPPASEKSGEVGR